MELLTIAEIYLENVLVKNTENIDFEQLMEFMDIQYTHTEDKTNYPTTKDLNLTIGGNLDVNDSTHVTFLDIPRAPVIMQYYPGGKTKGFGWQVLVYVESCSANASAGEVVKFSASFKKAGPVTRL